MINSKSARQNPKASRILIRQTLSLVFLIYLSISFITRDIISHHPMRLGVQRVHGFLRSEGSIHTTESLQVKAGR